MDKTETILEERVRLAEELSEVDEEIYDRLDDIFDAIFETFGVKYIRGRFWIDGAGEGEIGDFGKLLYGLNEDTSTLYFYEDITFDDSIKSNFKAIVQLDGQFSERPMDLLKEIPISWIKSDGDIDEIRELVLAGKLEYEKRQAVTKLHQPKKKDENASIKASIKKKLTKKELAYLSKNKLT